MFLSSGVGRVLRAKRTMCFAVLTNICKGRLRKGAMLQKFDQVLVNFYCETNIASRRIQNFSGFCSASSTSDIGTSSGKKTLAINLASLLEESYEASEREKPRSRMELKRSLELKIKKRVKEQYEHGKFKDLVEKVIADPNTLQDAYNCIKLNSNVDITLNNDDTSFESTAEELFSGDFTVEANTFSILTRGSVKEVLVLPNLNLKVLQEAIRVVLEVVYRPHFSKISHGCRSGRGHVSALKFIKKDIGTPDWWFTVLVNKKLDESILEKLISIMEEKIDDGKLFSLIRSMFVSRVLNLEFGGYPKGHGLPQEGVLSPILMNIYLDFFDREFYRLSMKYETLNPDPETQENRRSKLRSWFRRNLKAGDVSEVKIENLSSRVHSCRFMDEMFFAVSGPEEFADGFKSEILNYLRESLHLDVDGETELLPCKGPSRIRFLGGLVRKTVEESPATKAIHKMKEKVELFALQKQEAWNLGTVRIGKKWVAHGLKKVKETEIKHLADPESVLTQISHLRKPNMKTDHWYKHLLKTWMQQIKPKSVESEVTLLSKHLAEPALPEELRNAFYDFQKRAKQYVSSETTSLNSLMQNSDSSTEPVLVTEIIAPIDAIKKRLSRYGLSTMRGYPRACSLLATQDDDQIVDWFLGIVRRWLRWFGESDNFSETKLLMCDYVRTSCIRTLASKHQIHESLIERRFDDELSRIPSHDEDLGQEIGNGESDVFENDEALMYGISYSGLCLVSVARSVSESRPCGCFVMGCSVPAPSVYTLHVMERQKFPGWKTGFSSCIHPSLNGRRFGLCRVHLKDLYLGVISLQSIHFGSWK